MIEPKKTQWIITMRIYYADLLCGSGEALRLKTGVVFVAKKWWPEASTSEGAKALEGCGIHALGVTCHYGQQVMIRM